ncbi:unnamed protein product [Closterium sp. NIES-54]
MYGPSRPCLRRPSLARPGPSSARPSPLPPVAGPSPPVAGPLPLVAALPLPPCRDPALLPPQSRPCPAAAPIAALPSPPVAALPCSRPVAALPCCRPSRGPDLNRQLRPCPAPAPAEPRCPAEPRRPAEPRHPTEPCRPAEPRRPSEPHCPACTATDASAAIAATAAMASPTVLTFDVEGRAVDFDVWVDDLQLFLQCDSRDRESFFDHTPGVSTAPPSTADSTVRSQWTTRDAFARLAVRSHLPSAERALFGQYKTAQSLYDAVVARNSSPATVALSRLMLPYLFPDLAAFATVADLITHLRTSDARYRAALPTEFCANPPPPCASRGDPRAPFFEGCPPVPLLPSVASAAAVDLVGTAEVGVASAPGGRRRNSKGKGGKGGGGDGGGGSGGGGGGGGGVGGGGVGGGSGGFGGGSGGGGGSGSGGGGSGSGGGGGGSGGDGQGGAAQRGGFGGLGVLVPALTFFALAGAVGRRALPRWGDLLKQNVAIFDLDFDAILAAMYAVTDSAEGDCYLCVPPDPGIESAALGASESAAQGTSESAAPGTSEFAAPGAGKSALSGSAPTEALHTFTLDSGASRSFFRDSTTLTPLSRPVAVSLADPSGDPVLAHSSMVPLCPAAPSGLLSGLHLPSFSTNLVSGADLQDAWVDQFTPGGQRVTHCTCSRTGHHLATFTRRRGSSLYTLTTASPPVTASGQVAVSGQMFSAASRSSPASPPCSCRPLSHETLLRHHRLGFPSLPRLRGMASRTLVSGLPRSLPSLPPGPAPTCVPCVEGRQRAAPHSSDFPPIEAPLQTLHMNVWGAARVRGHGHERYFLQVVDDYSRYTTVLHLCRKGEVTEVLIVWIRGARRQLSESFGSDLPVLRLHSDRGGEFSSDLLRAFCRAEGICQTFMLAASPRKNGIAERRIGMVMDVARTSMIHADAPHFLWPFAVQYVVHQINLQPRVYLPETTPTLQWTGKVGDASVFCVSGSRAFVHDAFADKLSSRAVPCDVTFDKSVSYYRLLPYRTAPLPPPPLFLAPSAPPVDPLTPQSPAPSGVSQVDPVEPVELAVESGAARGAERAGAGPGGAELRIAESEGAEFGGAEPERVEPERAEPGGAESGGAEPGGAEPERAKSRGPLDVPSWREPLSPQQLCEWHARRCRRAAGASGPAAGGASGAGATVGAAGAGAAGGAFGAAGGAAGCGAPGAAGPGCAGAGGTGNVGGPTGVGPAGGAGAAGPGGARTGGTEAAGVGGAAIAGAVATRGAAGVGATGGTGAGGAAGVVAGDPGAVSAVSGGAARPRPFYVPLLQQVLGLPPSTGPTPPLLSLLPVQSPLQLQPASPLPESCPESPVRLVRTGRHVPRHRPPPVPGTHSTTLRPSSAPQRVLLLSPPASSLPALAVVPKYYSGTVIALPFNLLACSASGILWGGA